MGSLLRVGVIRYVAAYHEIVSTGFHGLSWRRHPLLIMARASLSADSRRYYHKLASRALLDSFGFECRGDHPVYPIIQGFNGPSHN